MERWQVIKNGIPVQLCDTIEEAEQVYAECDADEIRRIEDDIEPSLHPLQAKETT